MEPRQDPKRMEALLARREREGLSWAELSRRSGLPVWKLRWWERRRSSRGRTSGKERRPFVPVQIAAPAPMESTPLEVVTPSGFRLQVPAGFDADHLRRLLEVLETGC